MVRNCLKNGNFAMLFAQFVTVLQPPRRYNSSAIAGRQANQFTGLINPSQIIDNSNPKPAIERTLN